ncbi:MAG: hypothetical protein MK137_06100, partial [Rickettsiales bacterium]|nr:hypothetical protein [Rickettsiales bacterium]
HHYLEQLLKQNTMPDFYSKGMASSVRAVALAALAEHGKISLNDLQRYHNHVKHMSLFGKAHYLQAALKVEGSKEIANEVTNHILGFSVQSGGKFSFNEELDDSYSRILATPLRSNCSILSALTEYDSVHQDGLALEDIPFKMVRTITQSRGKREHWENTQENMFCMNGLIDYMRKYESTSPKMSVSVALDDKAFGTASFASVKDDAVTFATPITKSDAGTQKKVTISKEGEGRLYHATRMRYAPNQDNAIRQNAGIDIRREYSVERNNEWVLLDRLSQIQQGELVRVDIFVSVPTARNFVVVDDPIPGGLEPVNRDLANTSLIDADKGKFNASNGSWWFQFNDWHHYNVSRWSFYHKELRHDSVRFYSDYLPAGNYHLSYTAQAIAEGLFTKLPVHAEEMYDPDIFGKGLPGSLNVGGVGAR